MTMPPEPPPAMSGAPMGPPLAEWPSRVLGALIDGAIVAIPYFILMKIVPILGILYWLAAWLWLRNLEGTTGQTYGKQVAKIRLVSERDGQPIGFGMSIVRAIAHIVDSIPCGLGYLWPLWDPKKQTFADKIMTTVVVQA